MMDLLLATSGGESQSASGEYVDDVFSTYLYTGNGTSQTINNGIDLAGKGGLVWIKRRSGAGGSHALFDSVRGRSSGLATDSTAAQLSTSSGNDFKSFNSAGFSIDSGLNWTVNVASSYHVSWTFRRAPKFFDVVTYTGNGTSNRQIAHGLGVEPGMVIVKATSTTGNWWTYHRSTGAGRTAALNTTAQFSNSGEFPTVPTSSHFYIGDTVQTANANGVQYVAYLFAHDSSAEGIIQCGSYVGNESSDGPIVNLGWEPQWVMIKSASISTPWYIGDEMRGFTAGVADGGFATLQPNASSAEVAGTQTVAKTSTGFRIVNSDSGVNGPGATYIYLAIRRPNKPPTSGTQVYNAITRTGTGATATVTGVGFAPDLVHAQVRNNSGNDSMFYDRLRGRAFGLASNNTLTEGNYTSGTSQDLVSFDMDGVSLGTVFTNHINYSGDTAINHFFRRAKGFFDVVTYTGTGVARTVAHNLGVAPELMIVKSRSNSLDWYVYHKNFGATKTLNLNRSGTGSTSSGFWNDTTPNDVAFSLGAGATNTSSATYVAYLFATLAGISKVGSYTGNGTSQTINCGFSTGSRFILVKRTDSTGDWYVWDSVRGIIAANDPHLSLNTTAAEVTTDDSVDPDASGFIVNQNTATNVNVNGGQYIFLAIA